MKDNEKIIVSKDCYLNLESNFVTLLEYARSTEGGRNLLSAMKVNNHLLSIVSQEVYDKIIGLSDGVVYLDKQTGPFGVGMYCYPAHCKDYVSAKAEMLGYKVIGLIVNDSNVINLNSVVVYEQLKLLANEYPDGISENDLAELYYKRCCNDASIVKGVSLEGTSNNTLLRLVQTIYCIRNEKVVVRYKDLEDKENFVHSTDFMEYDDYSSVIDFEMKGCNNFIDFVKSLFKK